MNAKTVEQMAEETLASLKVGEVCNIRIAEWTPVMRKVKYARRRIHGGGEWIEWGWEPEKAMPEGHKDCGYSGIRVRDVSEKAA